MCIRDSSNGETAKVALNNGIEKLSKQLRRYKRKIKNHKVSEEKNNFNDLKAQLQIIDQTSSFPNQLEETKNEPLIFAEIDSDIEILTVTQAVKKLSSDFKPALMFRNINHSGLNMIYKRNDGMIGWVDPRGLRSTLQI